MQNFIKKSIQSQKVFYRYFRRKGWKRFLKENVLESNGTNKTKALSIALGIFVGLTPLWGFHTVLVLFLAQILKLNKVLSYMCTHISAPPFVPFIIAISLFFGAPFVQGETHFSKSELNFDFVKNHFIQYLLGSIILAVAGSVVIGTLSFFIMNKFYPEQKSK